MINGGSDRLQNISGLSTREVDNIKSFLQGSVYSWCKNNPNQWFSIRTFMGGKNFDWKGTPLYNLYEKHINQGKSNSDAIKQAGIDAGWLLKRVLKDDERRAFDTKQSEMIRQYRWDGNEI